MRREDGRKDRTVPAMVIVGGHGDHYTGIMARKIPRIKSERTKPHRTKSRRPVRKPQPRAARALRAARAEKAAKLKDANERVAADRKAAAAALPQWTTAEIEEAFRRFQSVNPMPRGELEHINPFTLLIAVVLSAQATDAGVNKATPALFAAADTPEEMAALGETSVEEL